MNYPFDPHNISSDNSRNEFMMQESSTSSNKMEGNNKPMPQDMEKLFSYMKNVMSNPMLMGQMEKFLSARQAQKNSSFVTRQNQFFSMPKIQNSVRQPPDSYLIQTSQIQRPQPLRMAPQQHVRQVKTPQINPNSMPLKKGSTIPSPFVTKHIVDDNQPFINNYIKTEKFNSYEPIKSKFQQEKNRIVQKSQVPSSKSTVSFEDIPIKSSYIANQHSGISDSVSQRLAQYPQNQSQYYEVNPQKVIIKQTISKGNFNPNPKKYIQAEQRPLNGTNKDFKQLLMEKQLQSPFDQRPITNSSTNIQNNWTNEQYNDQQNEDAQNGDQRPKKQFLKRGTRQYLSSAKDKKSVIKPSKQIKNKDALQNLNSSRFGTEKQRNKTPTKRDVSQNRILSKRNTTINDKPVQKLKSRDNLNTSNNQSFYDQRQQQKPKRSITPKNQRHIPKSKSPILPPKNNKQSGNLGKINISEPKNQGSGKKKNVFDDSSSSDQERENNLNQEDAYENLRSNNLIENKINKKINSYKPEKEFNMFARQKKQEIIEEVYLTKNQLNQILQKHAPKVSMASSSKNLNAGEQKFNELRKKYTDLCNLVQNQKIEHEQQMQKQREQFQIYKQQEIQKMKNQKRVMERQVKSSMPSQSQNLQKDKQQVQNLKKELEKEKQEHKKKQKNNKILIEKYKKENEELKFKLQKLEEQIQKQSSNSLQNNFSSAASERQTFNSSSTNLKSNNTNDKSRSKAVSKDLSPVKGKNSKSSKTLEQNQSEEPIDDKNYKKTVPLYKGQQDKKASLNNENNKKNMASKNLHQNLNSDDQNLPTFKVDNKKNQQKKVSTQKKYQYVENSVQENYKSKKQNQLTHGRKNSNHQSKASSKNVFADDSDEENYHQENQQNQDEQDQQTGAHSGFFKAQPKYETLSDLMTTSFSIKNITPQMVDKLFKSTKNIEYCKYLQRTNNPKRIIVNSSKNGVDKKITNIYNDKSKQILFQNGVKKQIFEDGYTIIYFKNGDLKQKLADGTILYYFKEKQVDQITLVNGLNVYRFDNNQVELHFDGGKYIEIRHPDGTIKMLGSPIN